MKVKMNTEFHVRLSNHSHQKLKLKMIPEFYMRQRCYMLHSNCLSGGRNKKLSGPTLNLSKRHDKPNWNSMQGLAEWESDASLCSWCSQPLA